VLDSVNVDAEVLTRIQDRQIPSILAYVEGEEFHGNQAKAQLVRNADNTVAYFRDFLGQEYVLRNNSAGSVNSDHSITDGYPTS